MRGGGCGAGGPLEIFMRVLRATGRAEYAAGLKAPRCAVGPACARGRTGRGLAVDSKSRRALQTTGEGRRTGSKG